MKEFLREAFSETKPDGTTGTASFSRLATGLLVAFSLGWITASVWVATWHNFRNPAAAPWQVLPDAGVLAGLAAFFGTLYGINRGTAFFGTSK
jgi:hypothetical protein